MALVEFVDDQAPYLNANNLNNNFNELDNKITNLEDTINDIQNYSTTEQVVGKWINNKPIYRKVVQGTYDLSSTGTHFFSSGISNVDKLIHLTYELDGSLYNVTYNSAISAIGLDTSNNIYIYTNVNWDSAMPFTFIIEYTKTTD